MRPAWRGTRRRLRVEPNLAEALEQQQPERAGQPADLAAPTLDRLEVAQLLVEHAAEHDAGDAHRPRPRQRLGRGSRAADHDLAGGAGVDRSRAQLLAGIVHRDDQLAVHRLAGAAHASSPAPCTSMRMRAGLDRAHPSR